LLRVNGVSLAGVDGASDQSHPAPAGIRGGVPTVATIAVAASIVAVTIVIVVVVLLGHRPCGG
jgi:hypothetical protein